MIVNNSQESEIELMQIKAKQDLRSMFFMITFLTIFCLLLNSNMAFSWDYKISIIYCCIIQFTFMVQKILGSKKVNSQCCFAIIESILILTYLLALVYNWEISQININYISYAVLVLQFIILALTVLVSRNSIELEGLEQNKQIQDILIAAIKSIASLQVVFITLKWTAQINWSWFQTLIIVWFSLGTLLLIEFCLLIDLIVKCLQPKATQEEQKEQQKTMIIGSVWVNLTVGTLSIMPFLTLLGVALKMDQIFETLNFYSFLTSIVLYSIEIFYIRRNKEKLEGFLYLSDVQLENEQGSQQQQQQQPERMKEKLKKLHRESAYKIPQFMARLSATYYKQAERDDKKFRSKSLVNVQMKNSKKKIPDELECQDKKFDQLLSSPRMKLEQSESLAPDMTSRISKQQQLCLVCYERESNMINMPCGHGGFCQECAEHLLQKSDLCVLCRKPVSHTLIIQNMKDRESLVEVIGLVKADPQN